MHWNEGFTALFRSKLYCERFLLHFSMFTLENRNNCMSIAFVLPKKWLNFVWLTLKLLKLRLSASVHKEAFKWISSPECDKRAYSCNSKVPQWFNTFKDTVHISALGAFVNSFDNYTQFSMKIQKKIQQKWLPFNTLHFYSSLDGIIHYIDPFLFDEWIRKSWASNRRFNVFSSAAKWVKQV